MGRKPRQQHKAQAGSPAGAEPKAPALGGGWLKHTLWILVAVLVQAVLTLGVLTYNGGGAGAATAAPAKKPSTGAPPKPAVCPEDWPRCPRIPGVDWPSLFALADADEAALSPADLDGCSPEAMLSPRAVPGMHLACVLPVPAAAAAVASALLVVHTDMDRSVTPTRILVPKQLSKLTPLISALEHRLRLKSGSRPARWQRPAWFTDTGVRIESLRGFFSLLGSRALLFEGGQWLWPPVEQGHAHLIPDLVAPGVTTRVVTLSLRPLVVEIENFLTGEEASHIISRASPFMKKSGVALKDADRDKAAKEFRTSSQYFLATDRDPMLERVDRRVSMLTRIPISHAEYIQVLRYNHMEHYSAHHDFFDPSAYRANQEMLESVEYGAKNRLATVFFYLNNVTSGGATNFPRAATEQFPEGGPQPRDYFDCSKGLSVYPQEGKVIIFYSLLPNGEQDDFSLHGGCDVLKAEETKWSANFWLWNKEYHFISPARQQWVRELKAQWL